MWQDQIKEKHIGFRERVDKSVVNQEFPVIERLVWHVKEYQENKTLHDEEFDYTHILEPYLSEMTNVDTRIDQIHYEEY